MHVIVFGAGALGRIYGVRLAAAGVQVSFVVRPSRLEETYSFVIEQVNGSQRRDVIERPRRIDAIPNDATLILLAVRFDQIDSLRSEPDGELARALAEGPSVPIVVLSPVLAPQVEALERAFSRRVVIAMPGVAGYVDDVDDRGVVRYWATGLASTLIDDRGAGEPHSISRDTLEVLARRLTNDGLPTRFERDVPSLDASSTTSFFPLIAAIDAGGGIDGVLGDKDLLDTALAAAKESEQLAKTLGKPASWAHALTRFIGPYTIKPGVTLARRVAPETVRFVERHFGRKLHAQHLAMGDTIRALGRDHGIEMPALDHLLEIMRRRPAHSIPAPPPAPEGGAS
ncbi:ketopantoate reductase family protein [Polyangium aurulentum]|uniref:ketopantoate reductase family protein n=1 Tax=Polyangium aurulentum TaxID=2567896 RepID=UPI0010AE3E88|nr:2-dehydropantoate 2-reductase N-terminal domain-containing protein [Polyangium aurulentum]UQA61689.1 oxidoreductase [Polyangium aurulentum]